MGRNTTGSWTKDGRVTNFACNLTRRDYRMNITIGLHLEALRLSCGYSLRESAKRSGLSHGYIRDVELSVNRKSKAQIVPMPQTLRKFAYAYRVNFNELMQIAGYVEKGETDEKPSVLVEIDLNYVLFVQVNDESRVNYHLNDRFYTEEKSLHEYMLLEERLESYDFLRVMCGIYVNLNHLRAFDEINYRIFFDNKLEGKFVEVTLLRAKKIRGVLDLAIAKNNNWGKEFKLNSTGKTSLIVRNLVF
jgi:transcriptional regulator with XRE-family HTH domain